MSTASLESRIARLEKQRTGTARQLSSELMFKEALESLTDEELFALQAIGQEQMTPEEVETKLQLHPKVREIYEKLVLPNWNPRLSPTLTGPSGQFR